MNKEISPSSVTVIVVIHCCDTCGHSDLQQPIRLFTQPQPHSLIGLGEIITTIIQTRQQQPQRERDGKREIGERDFSSVLPPPSTQSRRRERQLRGETVEKKVQLLKVRRRDKSRADGKNKTQLKEVLFAL